MHSLYLSSMLLRASCLYAIHGMAGARCDFTRSSSNLYTSFRNSCNTFNSESFYLTFHRDNVSPNTLIRNLMPFLLLTLGDVQNTIQNPLMESLFLEDKVNLFILIIALDPSDAKKKMFFNRCSSTSSGNAFLSALNMLSRFWVGRSPREKNEKWMFPAQPQQSLWKNTIKICFCEVFPLLVDWIWILSSSFKFSAC